MYTDKVPDQHLLLFSEQSACLLYLEANREVQIQEEYSEESMQVAVLYFGKYRSIKALQKYQIIYDLEQMSISVVLNQE
jgi:hypothetical protein